MLRRSPILLALAALTLTFGILAEYQVRADDPAKPNKKTESKGPELGKDWGKLRDGLNGLFAQLQKDSNIKPSRICDDDTFCRRIYLDLLGRPPLPEEIEAFNPGRRDADGNRVVVRRTGPLFPRRGTWARIQAGCGPRLS